MQHNAIFIEPFLVREGSISKKIDICSTKNTLKQILGTLLKMVDTSIVSKNTNGIKSTALTIFTKLFIKNKSVN